MPIRPEFKHFYRRAVWAPVRERIRRRAGDRCERCGKSNGAALVVARDGSGRWARAGRRLLRRWRDRDGRPAAAPLAYFEIRCVCCVAHLDHDPANNADENLKLLCQRCHLEHDRQIHLAHSASTRAARKDDDRPLLRLSQNSTNTVERGTVPMWREGAVSTATDQINPAGPACIDGALQPDPARYIGRDTLHPAGAVRSGLNGGVSLTVIDQD